METRVFPAFCFLVNQSKISPANNKPRQSGKGKKNRETSFLKIYMNGGETGETRLRFPSKAWPVFSSL